METNIITFLTYVIHFCNTAGDLHEMKLRKSQNIDMKFHLYFEIKSVLIII